MAFEDEVRRIARDISQRMAMLGDDGPSPDFWTLVGSRIDEEAAALGVDRLALAIAVQSALADNEDSGKPVETMTELFASLRAQTGGHNLSLDELVEISRSLLDATVNYVVKEAYQGSSLSFWHVLVARLRADIARHNYPGAALLETLLSTVRTQTGIDAERRPNEAAVILCRGQLQRDFMAWAGRSGALRLVIYPDGSITYRAVGDVLMAPPTAAQTAVATMIGESDDDDEDEGEDEDDTTDEV